MKKILFFLILAASTFAANEIKAQSGRAYVFPLTRGDTLIAATAGAAADTVFKTITITSYYPKVGIEASVRVLSGTLSGKAYLMQSYDNINWQLTDSASYVTPINVTGTTTTASKVASFDKIAPGPVYISVMATSAASTVSGVVTIKYTARPNSIAKP